MKYSAIVLIAFCIVGSALGDGYRKQRPQYKMMKFYSSDDSGVSRKEYPKSKPCHNCGAGSAGYGKRGAEEYSADNSEKEAYEAPSEPAYGSSKLSASRMIQYSKDDSGKEAYEAPRKLCRNCDGAAYSKQGSARLIQYSSEYTAAQEQEYKAPSKAYPAAKSKPCYNCGGSAGGYGKRDADEYSGDYSANAAYEAPSKAYPVAKSKPCYNCGGSAGGYGKRDLNEYSGDDSGEAYEAPSRPCTKCGKNY